MAPMFDLFNRINGSRRTDQPMKHGMPQYEPPPPPPRLPPPAPVRIGDSTGRRLLTAGLGLGLGVIVGVVLASAGPSSPTAQAGAAPTRVASTKTAKPSPTPVRRQPTRRDLKINVKELERSCFGSAGCNVTFRVKPQITNRAPWRDGTTYEVTYRVLGGEQPKLGSFTITDGTASVDEKDFLSVSSSAATLRATVTDVEAIG